MATFPSFTVKWKMFSLIVFGFLAISIPTTADARTLGGQKCTWGPSYWCQNIRQSSAVIIHLLIELELDIKYNFKNKFSCP